MKEGRKNLKLYYRHQREKGGELEIDWESRARRRRELFEEKVASEL